MTVRRQRTMDEQPAQPQGVIDLKQCFGQRFRIVRDPAASERSQDPWYWVIPCRYGEIYPLGGQMVAAMVASIRVALELERRTPGLCRYQTAEDAIVFVFEVGLVEVVAARIGARRRRTLSREHWEAAVTALRAGRDSAQKSCQTSTSEHVERVWEWR
jgi:hypothetical protein